MNKKLKELLKFCDDNELAITFINIDDKYPIAHVKYKDGRIRCLYCIDGDWE